MRIRTLTPADATFYQTTRLDSIHPLFYHEQAAGQGSLPSLLKETPSESFDAS